MTAKAPIPLVCDKQCPACDFYCKLARIRADVGELKRNFLLKVLGKTKINNLGVAGNDRF